MQYRGGGGVGGFGKFDMCGVVWELDSRGVWVCWHFAVMVRKQVLEIWCQGALVWRHLSPARKIYSISKGDPF